MNYAEKLKDPRWQKKRLEILNRDSFKCIVCLVDDKTLHVHHKTYVFGNDPWDYPNNNFETLCEDCHKATEDFKGKFINLVNRLLINDINHSILYNHLSKLLSNAEPNAERLD